MNTGKAKDRRFKIVGLLLVGVTGFEPATFWSRTKRATKLRYTPKKMEPMWGLGPQTC